MKKLMICLLASGLTACAGSVDIDAINVAQYVCKDKLGVRTIHDNLMVKGVSCQDSSFFNFPTASRAYREYVASLNQESSDEI